MKTATLILAALAASIALAKTEVFRLERDTETGALALVGVDNVRRAVEIVPVMPDGPRFVSIDEDEYAMLTGNVAKVWAALNSTDDGRVKLHGKRVLTEILTNEATKVTHYADGYRFAEKMPKRTPPRPPAAVPRTPKARPEPTRPANVSPRAWEMRKRLAERKAGKVREVNVVHDATTGTDKEVK